MPMNQKRLFGPLAAVTTPTDSALGRYEVPASTTTIIKQVVMCNTSASTQNAFVAIGTTSTAANRLLSNLALSAYETVSFNCSVVMAAGEKLYMTATATSVTFTVSGIEET